MRFNLKDSIRAFVSNETDRPIIGGLSVGLYMLLFYYSNNFDLANSWQQLLFFSVYFIVLPIAVLWLAFFGSERFKSGKYTRQLLFIGTLSFLLFFVLQNLNLIYSYKRIFVVCFAVVVAISFRFRNYKVVIVLLWFASIFPAITVAQHISANLKIYTNVWNTQPDGISDVQFKKKPNVYYIQVDGYANVETLKKPSYNYDNSEFDNWLESKDFKLYPTFRSNYSSTLKSNASCFNMLHHYSNENSDFKNAADFIIDENAVVAIFKRNGYKSFFITEKPYLLMNRPEINFDYCNFTLSELPYLQDGWSVSKEIAPTVKQQILQSKNRPNFFFIEKFDPGHIAVSNSYSKGKETERDEYLKRLQVANAWLKDMIAFLTQNDPNAIIIIGADHGGFVGFDYSKQAVAKIKDKQLLNSIFGAALAIKWNDERHSEFDRDLKTSVNLFRTLFSYLSDNKKYLESLQFDASYNGYSATDETKIYKAIE